MSSKVTRATSRSLIVASAVASVLALSGCDPLPEASDWSIKFSASRFWLAACASIEGDSLSAEAENSSGERWTAFWDVTDGVSIRTGEAVEAGVDSSELGTQSFDPAPLNGAEGVSIWVNDGKAQVANAYLAIPEGYVGEGWVRIDGTVTDDPCG